MSGSEGGTRGAAYRYGVYTSLQGEVQVGRGAPAVGGATSTHAAAADAAAVAAHTDATAQAVERQLLAPYTPLDAPQWAVSSGDGGGVPGWGHDDDIAPPGGDDASGDGAGATPRVAGGTPRAVGAAAGGAGRTAPRGTATEAEAEARDWTGEFVRYLCMDTSTAAAIVARSRQLCQLYLDFAKQAQTLAQVRVGWWW